MANKTAEGVAEVGRQGLSYVLVGGGTALLEFGLFQLLYEVLHLPLELSNVCATLVATAANFLINRNVTFKSTSNPLKSLVLYCLLFIFNMTISTFAIATMVGWGIPSAVAKLVMQASVVVWNFIIYRKVIFV